MAFTCTLNPDQPLLLTHINSEEGQGETIIRIPIGVDHDTGAIFSAFVCLATLPGFGATRHELVFHVVEALHGNENFWSDGLETLAIITNPIERERILQVICIATDKLIDQVAPVEVEMMTHEANLPPKALRKYGIIGSVFLNRGYISAHPDPYHGHDIWMFTQP